MLAWFDDAFFFGTDPKPRKARNLRAYPEIVVHLESGDDCVILEGVVEEESDPGLCRRAGEAYAAKYGFDALGGADEGGPPSTCCVRASRSRGWRPASPRPRRDGVSRFVRAAG